MANMTPQQIKNVATGFLHVLRSQDSVYGDWQKVAATRDLGQIGSFVQNVMHLQSTPTPDEIHAMDDHMAQSMQDDVASLQNARPDAPQMTICGVQEES